MYTILEALALLSRGLGLDPVHGSPSFDLGALFSGATLPSSSRANARMLGEVVGGRVLPDIALQILQGRVDGADPKAQQPAVAQLAGVAAVQDH